MCLACPEADVRRENQQTHHPQKYHGGDEYPTVGGRKFFGLVPVAGGAQQQVAGERAGQVPHHYLHREGVEGEDAFGAFVFASSEFEESREQDRQAPVEERDSEEGNVKRLLEGHIGVRGAKQNPGEEREGHQEPVPEEETAEFTVVVKRGEDVHVLCAFWGLVGDGFCRAGARVCFVPAGLPLGVSGLNVVDVPAHQVVQQH